MTRLANLHRSFPTVRLIGAPFRWIGQSRRRIWCVVLTLLAIVAGPPLWWATQLMGLPDIGDPFDVQEFRSFTIPDDRNAFVLYHQAATLLKPWGQVQQPQGNKKVDLYAPWSKADPEVRRWAEENREAMAVYRRGTGRPDALDPVPEFQEVHSDRWDLSQALYSLRVLALLESSRLEEQGDMAGAWIWYRAVLRTGRHIGMKGTVIRRLNVHRWNQEVRGRLITWAADPRTTPALLRQALDDAVACEWLAPSESYMLRAEYQDMDRMLDDPKGPGPQMPPAWFMSLTSWKSTRPHLAILLAFLTPEQMQSVYSGWRVWRREPERSRRVIRLVMANWLAYYDLPPENRPKPDLNGTSVFDFYSFGPESPAKARILSPEALSRWLDTTHDAPLLLQLLDLSRIRMNDWANHRELLILLGTDLYRRDHGTDPPTPDALVGPYLKSLPAELPDDARNEAIPGDGKTVQ